MTVQCKGKGALNTRYTRVVRELEIAVLQAECVKRKEETLDTDCTTTGENRREETDSGFKQQITHTLVNGAEQRRNQYC